MGAWLEFVYNALIGANKEFEFADYAKAIRAVGAEHCILSSDLGQAGNPLHPDGLVAFFAGLKSAGLPAAEIDRDVEDQSGKGTGVGLAYDSRHRNRAPHAARPPQGGFPRLRRHVGRPRSGALYRRQTVLRGGGLGEVVAIRGALAVDGLRLSGRSRKRPPAPSRANWDSRSSSGKSNLSILGVPEIGWVLAPHAHGRAMRRRPSAPWSPGATSTSVRHGRCV